jgi:hypothetical protein
MCVSSLSVDGGVVEERKISEEVWDVGRPRGEDRASARAAGSGSGVTGDEREAVEDEGGKLERKEPLVDGEGRSGSYESGEEVRSRSREE